MRGVLLALLLARAAAGQVAGEVAMEGVRVEAAATEGAPPLELRADRSSWDLAARSVVFEGSVELVRGGLRLACDRLVVRYDEAGRVVDATATGAVRATQADRTATGARAELTVGTGELVLTGAPELRDPLRRLTGERIVLHLDDDRVDCDRCRLVVAGEAVPVGEGSRSAGSPR